MEDVSVEELRQALLDSGQIDKATLDSIADSVILEVYQETLAQQQAQ